MFHTLIIHTQLLSGYLHSDPNNGSKSDLPIFLLKPICLVPFLILHDHSCLSLSGRHEGVNGESGVLEINRKAQSLEVQKDSGRS